MHERIKLLVVRQNCVGPPVVLVLLAGVGRVGEGGEGGALQSHLVRADHQSSLSVSHLLITPAVIPAHSECDAAVVLQHTVQTPVLLSDWITLPVT